MCFRRLSSWKQWSFLSKLRRQINWTEDVQRQNWVRVTKKLGFQYKKQTETKTKEVGSDTEEVGLGFDGEIQQLKNGERRVRGKYI